MSDPGGFAKICFAAAATTGGSADATALTLSVSKLQKPFRDKQS